MFSLFFALMLFGMLEKKDESLASILLFMGLWLALLALAFKLSARFESFVSALSKRRRLLLGFGFFLILFLL
ncbi:MAG: hypothetical protein Q4B42_06105, partial [Oscillospiraceae bacterium]|nr:hypothetical protein [Oscillospiraceae bacterium]